MYIPDRNRWLLGATVRRIHKTADGEALIFTLEADGLGTYYVDAVAWGDCCSHTWIESIENADAILGKRIVAVEDLDMPEPVWQGDKWGGDLTQFYGLAIRTEDGSRCVIEYRNSSNGYYGGNLNFARMAPERALAALSAEDWEEVGKGGA